MVSNCEHSVMRVGLVKDSCEKYITCWWIGLLEVQCIFNIRMWCEEKDGRVPMSITHNVNDIRVVIRR